MTICAVSKSSLLTKASACSWKILMNSLLCIRLWNFAVESLNWIFWNQYRLTFGGHILILSNIVSLIVLYRQRQEMVLNFKLFWSQECFPNYDSLSSCAHLHSFSDSRYHIDCRYDSILAFRLSSRLYFQSLEPHCQKSCLIICLVFNHDQSSFLQVLHWCKFFYVLCLMVTTYPEAS